MSPIRAEARGHQTASFYQDFGTGLVDGLFEEFPRAVTVGDKEDRFSVCRPCVGKILVGVEYQPTRLAPLPSFFVVVGEERLSRFSDSPNNKALSIGCA